MGVAQAGIIFRPQPAITNWEVLLAQLSGKAVMEISQSASPRFDTRNPGDVLVEKYHDVCVISNNELAWDFLEYQEKDVSVLYEQLGKPGLFIVFCCYDAGGSYGYAFVENGQRTRTRLQTTGVPRLPPLRETGSPKEFEIPWLQANHCYDDEDEDCPVEQRMKIFYVGDKDNWVSEDGLTGRLLRESMEINFGVCPWTSAQTPEYRYFRASEKLKEIMDGQTRPGGGSKKAEGNDGAGFFQKLKALLKG